MNGGSKPNPLSDSMIQSFFDRQAASDQQRMNMFGQSTPYGSLDYQADPNSPSGYRAVQKFTPEIQALLDSNIGNSRGISDLARKLIGSLGDRYSQPFSLNYGDIESKINSLARNTVDPLWSQREEQFNQRLANMGLNPGSEAYKNQARNFGDERGRAYNDLFLRGHEQAVNDILRERNQPLNELASLMGGTQINAPVSSFGFTQTPQSQIRPVDYMGASRQSYQDSRADRDAMLGGLFGLGGAIGSAGLRRFL